MIALEMLEFLAQKRRIISFSSGADFDRVALMLKFAIEDGTTQVIHIPAKMAQDILGRGRHAAKHFKWKDLRNALPAKMPETLQRFFASRPEITMADWQARSPSGVPHTAIAHQLDAFQNGFIWTMWLTQETPTLIWIDPDYMFELMDLLANVLETGDLMDPRDIAPPIKH
jgi:hypothetical protein